MVAVGEYDLIYCSVFLLENTRSIDREKVLQHVTPADTTL